MEKLTVGQRIDIYEINQEGSKAYNSVKIKEGIQLPALSVDDRLVYLKLDTYHEPLCFTITVFAGYLIECKKIGTMVIKSLK